MKKTNHLIHGMRDGIPIGLGYFAVAFSLGIAAANAGMQPHEGFVMSVLTHASAGEYAGIDAILRQASYWSVAMLILIANARYLLMSFALSQRLSPKLSGGHRLLMGFCITDEIFGVSVAYDYPLPPAYMYGAALVAIPSWALGTALGIVAGQLLPTIVVNALSAAIFGMFLAIIIPPCRTNKVILGLVAVSFLFSCGSMLLPWVKAMEESVRVIILTLLLSAAAAILFPIKEETGHE